MKQNLKEQLIDRSSALPEFALTLPGIPLSGSILPNAVQLYFRDTRHRSASITFLHNRYVFVTILAGCLKIQIEGSEYDLSETQAILIHPGQAHRFVRFPETSSQALFASFSLIDDCAQLQDLKGQILSLTTENLRLLNRCTSLFLQWYGQNASAAYTLIYPFGELLQQLVTRYRVRTSQLDNFSNYQDGVSELLKKIQWYQRENQHRQVSIQELSKKFNISSSYLRTVFKKATGRSLGQFLRFSRLNYANSALRSSNLNVAQIAEQCGYESESAFVRAFKRETKLTPLQYRQMVRRGKLPSTMLLPSSASLKKPDK